MFKRFSYALCVLFICVGFAVAEPKAIITGRDNVQPGTSVWLKTDGSQGNSFEWRVIPETANTYFTILPIFGGMDTNGKPIVNYWGHFECDVVGVYHFIFVATESDKSDIAIHQLRNGEGDPNPPSPDTNPFPPLPDIPEPSVKFKERVKDLPLFLVNSDNISKDAANLTMFYWEMGDVISKDDSTLETTRDIRKLNTRAGGLMFQKTGIKNKYENLGEMIDWVLEDTLGLNDVELSDSKRDDAVQAFQAIAWSFKKKVVK